MRRADCVAAVVAQAGRSDAVRARAAADGIWWRVAPTLMAFALAALSTWAHAQALPESLVQPSMRLTPDARVELESHRAILASMDDTQRDTLRQRIAEWTAQSPALQRKRRSNWQAWRALPATEQQRLTAAAQAWRALAPAEQQALRARFDAMDASDQHGWLLGPALGVDYPRLHPLIAQVPFAQRDALLAALRAMPATERDDLAVLAQRTPPQERDELRTRWLATPPAQRGEWLTVRLGR